MTTTQNIMDANSPSGVKQFLTFLLNDENYGVDILHIKEIIEYGNVTTIPLMPKFIAGVLNLRGSVVPIISLSTRFDQIDAPLNKKTSIIIIDVTSDAGQHAQMGIIVDLVNEVIELPQHDIAPAPKFGTKISADFIKGMAKIGDNLMVLLDVNHVLSLDELSVINEMSGG